ncbi:MAG: aspartate racemase [Hyphomicrobiales bacterium]|nr:MAG: aspartate racemase [Hyphomicrobiales bacterium]
MSMAPKSQLKQEVISRPKLRYAVIGGLGAVAGADILHRIVKSTPVKSDNDHLDIAFVQRPFFEETTPNQDNYDPTARKFYIYDCLKEMDKDQRDIALLPCFISQTFLHEIAPEVNLHILGIVDAIIPYLEKNFRGKTIGILTSNYVRNIKYFENKFNGLYNILYPSDENQELLMNSVYGEGGVKSGGDFDQIKTDFQLVCEDLVEQGADIILPGFTDIPSLLEQISYQVPIEILNSNQIYAEYAIKFATKIRHSSFKIGVVGGIGPAATIDFLTKIVKNTPAEIDQDHLKIVVEQNPQIPDRTANILGDGDDPTIALYSCCKKLEQGGANIIAIPCNTAHAYVTRIQQHLSVPIINMLSEMVQYVCDNHPKVKNIGLLATTGTISSELYQNAFKAAGLNVIVPNQAYQAKVMEAIYGEEGVKAGFTSGKCEELIHSACKHLYHAKAELVILGCTELPLISTKIMNKDGFVLLDPTEVLAEKCVKLASEF